MMLHGDYLDCLSTADLRRLEMHLFSVIDHVKVRCMQETRIRRECAQESLESTSSSEGSDDKEEEYDEEKTRQAGFSGFLTCT